MEIRMKPVLHALVLSAALTCLTTELASAADLTINVSDIKSASGTVNVAVFNTAQGFLKEPLTFTAAPAVQGTTTLTFKDLPSGDYAFAVYHDANANGKMDSNLVGMPTEDYAFSNNAMGKMGPPTFDAARFSLPAAGAALTVSVR
jgi:uncharacterized protein (DUF2141 family)